MAYETAEEYVAACNRYMHRIRDLARKSLMGNSIPVPTLITKVKEKWRIINGNAAHVNKVDRELKVPFAESALARAIRIEELLHIKYSPPRTPKFLKKMATSGIRDVFFQVAEDFRVILFGRLGLFYNDKHYYKGIKHIAKQHYWAILSNPPNQMAFLFGKCPYPFEMIARAVTAGYPIDYGRYLIDEGIFEAYVKQYKLEGALNTSYTADMFMSSLKELLYDYYIIGKKEFNKSHGRIKSKPGIPPFTMKLAKQLEELVSKYELANSLPPPPKEEPPAETEEHITPEGDITPEYLDKISSKLTVIKLPLTRRLLFKIKTKTCSSQGFQIKRIENMCLDPINPPIFAARVIQNTKWPVILLDASGSMTPTTEMVKTLIQGAPGASIMYYSGRDRSHSGYGNLAVVSEKGYFCDENEFSQYFLGNNIVDWPAIRWVLKNYPGRPTHWITDKGYTWAVGHAKASKLNPAVTAFAKMHGVTFHSNVTAFLNNYKRT